MQRVSQIALLITGLLGCACTLADDSDIQIPRSALLSDYDPPLAQHIGSDSYRVIDPLEFQDNSTLGRLKRLREFSLLTLAESRKSKVFLGVNSDGLVGLHVRLR